MKLASALQQAVMMSESEASIKNEMNPNGARLCERHLGAMFVTTKLISSTIHTTS